jgi:hypothetical protein
VRLRHCTERLFTLAKCLGVSEQSFEDLRRSNKEMDTVTKTEVYTLIYASSIKQGRMQWARHVAHMGYGRN